ncbi:MAG: PIG-L family deacetylase, partial [Xanthomonadaceae bacterium]|nr:PIG-L family deacetylase [Xanthomonadaceae bacterium]
MDRLSARTRLLVVAPHPDDETLATGILIQRVLAAGGTVTVLLLTDGDNNPWPQRWLERRLLIGAAGRARWAARRRAELCAALRTLGVDPGQVIAMGWPDQGLTRQVACGAPACVDALVPVLARVRPNLLVMPALDDRHPDHGAAHVLMRLALERWTERPEVWLYRVHGGRRTARVVVPCVADATTRERKRAALGCHASQLVLSGRRMQRFAARSECFEPLEVRSYPQVLPWRP